MGKYITYPRTPDGNIEHEPDAIVMHSDASLDQMCMRKPSQAGLNVKDVGERQGAQCRLAR